MNITPLAPRAGAAAARLVAWAQQRASEQSTKTGLVVLAGVLGWHLSTGQAGEIANALQMVLGLLGTALAAATTSSPHPPAQTAPADPQPAAPVPLAHEDQANILIPDNPNVLQETNMTTILAVLEADAIAILKAAGKAVESFFLTETQKFVAQAKQTYLGTLGLNLIQTMESQSLTGEQKMETVVAMLVPAIEKFVASGGLPSLVGSVEDFAREFAQSLFNDFAADVAKIAAPTQAAA
ncbi:MAG TPA: hypothetical protein VKQ27_17800 [Acetobacteraceae bacterium]|nr:hypothetical protein [Acetobacteraceae bacterium]